jgi:hypothetical protein
MYNKCKTKQLHSNSTLIPLSFNASYFSVPWVWYTRHVHKVSFPLVPQLANLILREATAHT